MPREARPRRKLRHFAKWVMAAAVLGAVVTAYAETFYVPVFSETFESYTNGPLAGQGTWLKNPSESPNSTIVVGAEGNRFAAGDGLAPGSSSAANCFFPNIFADGNTSALIEFDVRPGVFQVDFRIGPAGPDDGGAFMLRSQSIGGQWGPYDGGCFTSSHDGHYDYVRFTYWALDITAFHHMLLEFQKADTNVTITVATVDGQSFPPLKGLRYTLTDVNGINSFMVAGIDRSDGATPGAVDNITVSLPYKPTGATLLVR